MTNREKFEFIGSTFRKLDAEVVSEDMKTTILEFCETQIAALDRKNEKARERQDNKRAEGKALKDAIEAILSDEPKTINDILAELKDETLTPAKITARLTQLRGEGKVEKSLQNIDGRKLTTYVAIAG